MDQKEGCANLLESVFVLNLHLRSAGIGEERTPLTTLAKSSTNSGLTIELLIRRGGYCSEFVSSPGIERLNINAFFTTMVSCRSILLRTLIKNRVSKKANSTFWMFCLSDNKTRGLASVLWPLHSSYHPLLPTDQIIILQC
jgi:hypothetical protein